jgi:hypothetical protein
MATSQRKSYVIGVGMTNFIKPRGQVDYPGKVILSKLYQIFRYIYIIFFFFTFP